MEGFALPQRPLFVDVATEGEIENAVEETARFQAQALLIPPGDLFYVGRVRLLAAASKYAIPVMAADRDVLKDGALGFLSYSEAEQDQRYASFVDRILRGAKPAELPMEQPTRFEIGINLKAARALGIAVPKKLLLRADEVIQ